MYMSYKWILSGRFNAVKYLRYVFCTVRDFNILSDVYMN